MPRIDISHLASLREKGPSGRAGGIAEGAYENDVLLQIITPKLK